MAKESSAAPGPPLGRPGRARPLLLEAAIREFAEKGYEGATTAGIARRAEAAQPLVHHHFGSKEELFRTVLDLLFEELREALLPDGELGDPVSLVRRFVLFTARRPELARIWLIESARQGPHADHVLDKHIVPLTELLRPLVGAWVRDGTLPDVDPTMLLYALQGLACYPFLVREQVRRLSGCEAGSAEFAERYADAVLAILRKGTR